MDIKIGRKSSFGAYFLSPKTVTAETLVKILEHDTSEIESIEFAPPRVDSDNFGCFKVKWELLPYDLKDVL